jgi:hypothetical protein
MDALLTAIVVWLAANFDLPESYEHPRVTVVPRVEINEIHQREAVPGTASAGAQRASRVAAVYDTRTKTIYLAEGWTGHTPAETSILVHEMVHHLQNVSGKTFACAGEREKEAYAAQEQWLRLFGRNLKSEFGLDPFTLLVKTSCPR